MSQHREGPAGFTSLQQVQGFQHVGSSTLDPARSKPKPLLQCYSITETKACLQLVQVLKFLDQVVLQIKDSELAADPSESFNLPYVQLVQRHLFKCRKKPLVMFGFLHVQEALGLSWPYLLQLLDLSGAYLPDQIGGYPDHLAPL